MDTQVLKIKENIHWIGVLDPDIVTFDIVMETKYGTTYNSYLIEDEKIAIVEATKEKYWNTYLDKIKQRIAPEKIDYIVINHTEPDHSGNVANLLKVAPKATVVGSGNAIRYLRDQIGYDFPNQIVKDGDEISLGKRTLRFLAAPNLHWPDSTYTYIMEDKVLFTCDSFGSHFCDSRMFDDLVPNFDDAFTYYFNVILRPFSKFMLKAIEKIKPLEIDVICTGHGPILRSYWKKYVELSEKFATEALQYPIKKRVFIPYVSAYHNTGNIAEKIAEGINKAGLEAVVMDVENASIGDIDAQLDQCAGVIIGSPTINQNTLLPIYKIFALINPLRDRGKLGAGFGSYGWSGEAVKIIEANLRNLKLNLFGEGLQVKFTIHKEIYEQAIDFGFRFGDTLIKQQEKQE